jgi:hypothetical protein
MGKPNRVENLPKQLSKKAFALLKTCGKPVDEILKDFPSIDSIRHLLLKINFNRFLIPQGLMMPLIVVEIEIFT